MKRKRLISLVSSGFLALAMTSYSFGQAAVAVGGKVGLAVNSFRATGATVEARTTGLAGLFLNFQLSPAIAIQPEALITRRGATYAKNAIRTKVTLHYFEVPILLKLRLPIGDVLFPHLLVGPNLAFNTSASYSTEVQNGADITTLSANSNVNKTNIGGLVGGGIDIQAKRIFFTVDGRYGYSFNQVGENFYNVRNVGWTFSLGVGVRIGSGSGLD